ncbi:MAG: family 43 glycosylhydrolase [Dysgonamonadaceae bacterium]|jgi:hypothetical protein|nr:family 43 glycosylhydrolase [Dysgonamonadaceae bacterium]
MKKTIPLVLLLMLSVQLSLAEEGIPFSINGNPIVRDIYTADPSAHVWEDGRLYVYPSHDIYPSRGCDLMDKYHVYSTDDMVNWIDHGQILEANDVPWGEPLANDGKFMWAPDCAYKNGKYYFYFPHPNKDPWNENWKIGVAVSDNPASDFVVLDEPLKGLPERGEIDPCVFIDDDGQAYFYYGGGGNCYGAKLKENMIELDGNLQRMQGLYAFHEGPWLFKKDGLYYLTYPGNHDGLLEYVPGQDQLLYATSNSPLGPWNYVGSYLRPTGCDTSHGSVVKYKDQWYAFYHNIALSGNGTLRSICVDKLFFQEDGIKIQVVKQTRDCGSPYNGTPKPVPGIIEAEDFNEGGQVYGYFDQTNGNAGNAYRSEWVDIDINRKGDYFIFDTQAGEYLNYTIEVAETGYYRFECIASSFTSNLGSFHLEYDGEKITDPVKIEVPEGTKTNFKSATVEDIYLTQGTHIVALYTYGRLFIDKYIFTKQGEAKIELPQENPVSVYPNRSSGIFEVKSPQTGILTVSDIAGRKIRTDRITQPSYTLDITNKSNGVYIVSLQTGTRIYRTKLIKE